MAETPTQSKKSTLMAVLAIPQFRYLWLGQICSNLAMNTMLFVLALIIYKQTGSNTAVSALFLAYGVPAVLLGLAAGTIVDHLKSKSVLFACDLTRAILTIGLFFFSQNLIFIYLITLLNAIITQFYVPAESPTLPRIIPKHLLVSANSLFSFTFFTSLAVGSIFAGPLLRIVSPEVAYVIMALLFLIAAASVSRLKSSEEGDKGWMRIKTLPFVYLVGRVFNGLVEGINYIRQEKALMDSLMLLTGTQIILALLGALGPGLADRVLEIDVRDASVLIVGPAVLGIITGALWVGQNANKISRDKLIKWGITSAGVILIAISFIVRLHRVTRLDWFFESSFVLPLVVLLFYLLGVANSFLDVPANSILQEKAIGEMRGRVYGTLTAAVGGVGILPVILGGILADTIGVGRVIFILGTLITLYSLFRYNKNKLLTFHF